MASPIRSTFTPERSLTWEQAISSILLTPSPGVLGQLYSYLTRSNRNPYKRATLDMRLLFILGLILSCKIGTIWLCHPKPPCIRGCEKLLIFLTSFEPEFSWDGSFPSIGRRNFPPEHVNSASSTKSEDILQIFNTMISTKSSFPIQR
eukprot:scaffold208_cov63-Attheya_sp.AAC.17